MKMKHTQGPWKIPEPRKIDYREFKDFAIIDKDGEIIAETYYQVDYDKFRPSEANARLIASAPEMLDCLIDAYKGIIDEPSMLQSIIEKATGMKIEDIVKDSLPDCKKLGNYDGICDHYHNGKCTDTHACE